MSDPRDRHPWLNERDNSLRGDPRHGEGQMAANAQWAAGQLGEEPVNAALWEMEREPHLDPRNVMDNLTHAADAQMITRRMMYGRAQQAAEERERAQQLRIEKSLRSDDPLERTAAEGHAAGNNEASALLGEIWHRQDECARKQQEMDALRLRAATSQASTDPLERTAAKQFLGGVPGAQEALEFIWRKQDVAKAEAGRETQRQQREEERAQQAAAENARLTREAEANQRAKEASNRRRHRAETATKWALGLGVLGTVIGIGLAEGGHHNTRPGIETQSGSADAIAKMAKKMCGELITTAEFENVFGTEPQSVDASISSDNYAMAGDTTEYPSLTCDYGIANISTNTTDKLEIKVWTGKDAQGWWSENYSEPDELKGSAPGTRINTASNNKYNAAARTKSGAMIEADYIDEEAYGKMSWKKMKIIERTAYRNDESKKLDESLTSAFNSASS